MLINEHSRHELYGKLEQVLGDQAATTLMEHLPPVSRADVATKQDFRELEQRVDMKIRELGRPLCARHRDHHIIFIYDAMMLICGLPSRSTPTPRRSCMS